MKGQRFLDRVAQAAELNVTVLASSAFPKCECESLRVVFDKGVQALESATGAATAGECVPDDCLIRAAKIKNRAEMPTRVEMMKSVLNTTVEDHPSFLTEEDK